MFVGVIIYVRKISTRYDKSDERKEKRRIIST
jgi:hypothetical protein